MYVGLQETELFIRMRAPAKSESLFLQLSESSLAAAASPVGRRGWSITSETEAKQMLYLFISHFSNMVHHASQSWDFNTQKIITACENRKGLNNGTISCSAAKRSPNKNTAEARSFSCDPCFKISQHSLSFHTAKPHIKNLFSSCNFDLKIQYIRKYVHTQWGPIASISQELPVHNSSFKWIIYFASTSYNISSVWKRFLQHLQ